MTTAGAAPLAREHKDFCLSKCRSPLGFLIGSWREGLTGALNMGARHGASIPGGGMP